MENDLVSNWPKKDSQTRKTTRTITTNQNNKQTNKQTNKTAENWRHALEQGPVSFHLFRQDKGLVNLDCALWYQDINPVALSI